MSVPLALDFKAWREAGWGEEDDAAFVDGGGGTRAEDAVLVGAGGGLRDFVRGWFWRAGLKIEVPCIVGGLDPKFFVLE